MTGARRLVDGLADFVTTHNVIVVVAMLVLTAGVTAGVTQLGGASDGEQGVDFPPTTPAEKADYVEANYASDSADDRTTVPVYVRDAGGNALSRASLLESLRYQRSVLDDAAVADALADGGVTGVPNLVASRLADASDPSIDEQIAALEGASESAVEAAVRDAAAADDARRLLPRDYDAGSASAETHRLLFAFSTTDDGSAPEDATRALYDAADGTSDPAVFTLGQHALADYQEQNIGNTVALVLPVALALVLVVLAFTYRDLVDVSAGMVGVLVSILWMFGWLGWLGVDVGTTMIIGPVLVAGLSIDYGFHVFTRYREHRDSGDGVAAPMAASLRSVAFALGVVTLTTGIGFLSNVANPVGSIRTLGVGITLGVASALVVFVTLVPALKVTADSLLERVGVDRRKTPLGESSVLEPLLRGSVTLARRAAPVVLVVAVVAGTAGGVAWTTLDEQPFDRQRSPTADWKTDLPDPVDWEPTDYNRDDIYVQQHYRGVADDASDRVQLLVEGDVTAPGTLDRVRDGTNALADGGQTVSPAIVIDWTAARNDEFAATVAAADTDGDGVPDENLEAVYDGLYAAAPDAAARVVERSAGEYESLRVVGPADGGGSLADRAERQRAAADAVEGDGLTATAVSRTTIRQAGIEAVTAGILRVMALALAAVALTFVAVSRYVYGSATLGAVTVLPIALVVALVVAGMAVLDVPLTLVTALLMSLTIGLGVDYNIHLVDRFADELRGGRTPGAALEAAVVGTGGALVGSALTTAVAFVAILLHPSPQLQNFGTLVALALLASLLASVLVLPSVLVLWSRYAAPNAVADREVAVAASDD